MTGLKPVLVLGLASFAGAWVHPLLCALVVMGLTYRLHRQGCSINEDLVTSLKQLDVSVWCVTEVSSDAPQVPWAVGRILRKFGFRDRAAYGQDLHAAWGEDDVRLFHLRRALESKHPVKWVSEKLGHMWVTQAVRSGTDRVVAITLDASIVAELTLNRIAKRTAELREKQRRAEVEDRADAVG